MTIIAGFKCNEGIVLCADTQETVGTMKRNVPKLRLEPSEGWAGENDGNSLAVAFCGAGDGPFIDKLVETCWQSAKSAQSAGQACQAIEQSIRDHYAQFGKIFQPGYCPHAELIFGVKMWGESMLFSADGPTVNEVNGYRSSGVGQYMADFLASRMYGYYLTIHQCVILSAYILFQAKEHVDGCGGESHIAVLREQGKSGLVEWVRVNAITELVGSSDLELGRLLLQTANIEASDEQFRSRYKVVRKILEKFRKHHRIELKKWGGASAALSGNTALSG